MSQIIEELEMIKMPLQQVLRNKMKGLVLSEKKKIKQTKINGHEILVPVNEGIGWMIYYLKHFNKKETDFIRRIVEKNWVCFDIGANIGYYSLLFASLYKEVDVHSFEPQLLCYHLLNSSMLLNSFDNIKLNNFALSNYNGVSEFSISTKCESSSFVHTEMSPLEKKIQVDVHKLDDYIKEHEIKKIDFMKIDVEGSEKLVLEGAIETLSSKDLQPKLLLVELYEPNLVYYNTSIDEIVTLLNSYGYKAYVIPKKNLVTFTKEHHDIFYNVFFSK
jgi:FkbM family methyltransferase